VARRLGLRGLAATPLAALALGLALLGALAFAIAHPGLGGALGLLGVLLAWIAGAPGEGATALAAREGDTRAFPTVAAHACVAVLLAGAVLDAAADAAVGRAALASWTTAALLLLPLVRALAPAGRLAHGAYLWSWGERSAVLFLGPLLGHPTFGTFVVGAVASADLVLRLALLRPVPKGEAALPAGLAGLFGPDGRPQPGVRLAARLALAVLVLLYLLVGRSEGWRF
jgi:hypothetical protein